MDVIMWCWVEADVVLTQFEAVGNRDDEMWNYCSRGELDQECDSSDVDLAQVNKVLPRNTA